MEGRKNMDLWKNTWVSTDKFVPVPENKDSTENIARTRLVAQYL
jgi:hypothetical protein